MHHLTVHRRERSVSPATPASKHVREIRRNRRAILDLFFYCYSKRYCAGFLLFMCSAVVQVIDRREGQCNDTNEIEHLFVSRFITENGIEEGVYASCIPVYQWDMHAKRCQRQARNATIECRGFLPMGVDEKGGSGGSGIDTVGICRMRSTVAQRSALRPQVRTEERMISENTGK